MSLLKENFKTFYFVKAPEKCAVGTEEGVVRERRGELLLIHTHVEHLAVGLHSNVSWQAASQPRSLSASSRNSYLRVSVIAWQATITQK